MFTVLKEQVLIIRDMNSHDVLVKDANAELLFSKLFLFLIITNIMM